MKKPFIIHPILFAIFPILSLYNYNKDMAQLSYITRPLIISFLFAVIIFFILGKAIKNKNKAAVVASLFLVLFFSFGHFLSNIPIMKIGTLVIYNYYTLSFMLAVLFIFTTLIILTTKKGLNMLTAYLNIVAIILIVLPTASIGLYEYKTKNIAEALETGNYTLEAGQEKDSPDIYYIILDGYGREDVLKEIYNYDNSEFINYLISKGFYVADQSQANYAQTYQSISSALNFEYINYLNKIMGDKTDDRKILKKIMKDNKVYALLKNKGYLFVGTPSIWSGTYNNLKVDVYMKRTLGLSEFDNILISTTPLGVFLGKDIALNSHRKKILYTLDHLSDIAEISSPTFVYVHLLMPHPPFVFNQDGEPITPKGRVLGLDGSHYFKENPGKEKYKTEYVNQLTFLNKKLVGMIDEILNKSENPPVIILQADHGPGSMLDFDYPEKTNMKERMSILNAYYLPEEAKELLYESITPVNTFRIVFNYFFNADFELLDDKSYFATWDQPYKFIDVTEEVN